MNSRSRGLWATIAAYFLWGVSPAFWKLLPTVPAGELLAHRIVWSAVFLALLLAWRRQWRAVRHALTSPKAFATLVATALLVCCNWLIYLWAVTSDRILQASLGYYINPLVTVILAMLFLGERLSARRWLSVGLAAAGVAVLTVSLGSLPVFSILLAFSFGTYGLLRKTVEAEAEVGLFVEVTLLSVPALYFLLAPWGGEGASTAAFGSADVGLSLLLVASGLITATPLLLFNYGVRRLSLSVVGFLQYLAPTLQFLLAVVVYREPFGQRQLVAFSLIWAALALFSLDLVRPARRGAAARG